RRGGLERTALGRDGERRGIGIPPGDVVAPPPRGERNGGPHQPGADDGEPHGVTLGATCGRKVTVPGTGRGRNGRPPTRWRYGRRMSSATRKARSSDWRAFRRGSQSVM